jgi:hypothetical protein
MKTPIETNLDRGLNCYLKDNSAEIYVLLFTWFTFYILQNHILNFIRETSGFEPYPSSGESLQYQ